MMSTRYLLVKCLLILLSHYGLAQNDSHTYYGAEYSYGGILRHSDELPTIGQKRINGITLTMGQLHISKNKWEQCFCFPLIGGGLAAFDLGDKDVLGQSINPFLFVAPYTNPKGKLHIIPRGGAGLSYVTRKYDAQNNTENIFFSTHISFFLQLHLSLRYDITNKIQWQGSVSYNHISNGGIKQPNKGMNFVTANTGLNYFINKPLTPDYEVSKTHFEDKKRWQYSFTSFYSIKVASKTAEFNRKNCPIYGSNLEVHYFLPRFSYINAGIEYTADTYLRNQLMRQNKEKDFQRVALLIGHTARFGNLSFITDLGFYIYSPAKPMDPVYQHYRLTYHVKKYFFLGIGLKAHRHVADLMMINAGFSI